MNRFYPTVCSMAFGWLVSASSLLAAEPSYAGLLADEVLVPQTFLSLFHAEEVQRELGISKSDLESFMPRLQAIDGRWWTARNRPPSERRKIVAAQEDLLASEVKTRFGEPALRRLRQIELQSQGYRSLIRPEVARYISLTSAQQKQLKRLFADTESLAAKVVPGKEDAEAKSKHASAQKEEPAKAELLLTKAQKSLIPSLVGKTFETASLERIYPLAPEFVPSDSWFGEKTTLADLRGKVVLVHFYAFQCNNCQANFPIYNRWFETMHNKGVEIVGIQTPETPTERNVNAVCAAAKKDGFRFPVLVDLKKENWNAWSNTLWPTVYVIDKEGYIRMWWEGELQWKGATGDQRIEKMIDQLLAK